MVGRACDFIATALAALCICAAGLWDGLTGNAGEDETDEEWELLSAAWSRELKGGKTNV